MYIPWWSSRPARFPSSLAKNHTCVLYSSYEVIAMRAKKERNVISRSTVEESFYMVSAATVISNCSVLIVVKKNECLRGKGFGGGGFLWGSHGSKETEWLQPTAFTSINGPNPHSKKTVILLYGTTCTCTSTCTWRPTLHKASPQPQTQLLLENYTTSLETG